MKIINEKGYTPNVLHFHGMNKNQLNGTFHSILENHVVNNVYDKSRLKIVSTWTNEEDCCLYQQCKKCGIELVNCVPEDYDKTQKWYMPNKIKFFIEVLENTSEEMVMFLDGYDVLLTGLEDIIERFESQPYRILFGPSCNNYPEATIDHIYGRASKGVYCYFNAGCVIGYTQDLLKFYKQAYQYVNIRNPYNSEQFILRIAFSKYSSDKNQNFVGIDFKSTIFQSMGRLDTTFNSEKVLFSSNAIKRNKLLIIKEFFDTDEYFYTCSQKTINEVLKTSQIKNSELLEYIMENRMINYILFEVYDRSDLHNIFGILTEIAQKYEVKCYFVFPSDFEKSRIKELVDSFKESFKNKYNYFVLDSTLEELYDTFQ